MIKTLVEAILLVILVVYVFLQSMRSTFIPAISIVVSGDCILVSAYGIQQIIVNGEQKNDIFGRR